MDCRSMQANKGMLPARFPLSINKVLTPFFVMTGNNASADISGKLFPYNATAMLRRSLWPT